MTTPVYDRAALLTALKTALLAATWPEGDALFGPQSVIVSPLPPARALDQRRTPLAQISTRGDTADEDEPGLRDVQVAITLYTVDRRDEVGEAAQMGASDERGLEQLTRRAALALNKLMRSTVPIRNVRRGTGGTQLADGEASIVYEDLTFVATVAEQAE